MVDQLERELAELKGVMAELLHQPSTPGDLNQTDVLQTAARELGSLEQQLTEVSERCSLNSLGADSMLTGLQDLEKQVQGTVLQLSTVPAELEHKLRLMMAEKQATDTRHEAEKQTLEHRLTQLRTRLNESREQMCHLEERFSAESARLTGERGSQSAVIERLQMELLESKNRMAQISMERDNYHIQISKLQERLVQTEAAKGQLLTRAESLKETEMEKLRELLAKANGREAELLNELQASRTSRNGRVNEAQAQVHSLSLQLRQVQESGSRERDQLCRTVKKLEAQMSSSSSQWKPSADRIQDELTRLSGVLQGLQSSSSSGLSGSVIATIATNVHAAGIILDSVSRWGDEVLWSDHSEHDAIRVAADSVARLSPSKQPTQQIAALADQLFEIESSRASERDSFLEMEKQLAHAQHRFSTTQREVVAENKALLVRIADLEHKLLAPLEHKLLAPLGQPWAVESHLSAQQLHQGGQAQDEDKTLVRLQLALKEAIAEQVQMAEECAKLEANCKDQPVMSFDSLDINGDGVIDRTEYNAAFASL